MKKIPLMKGTVGVKVSLFIILLVAFFCMVYILNYQSQSNSSMTLNTLFIIMLLATTCRIASMLKNVYNSISKRTYLSFNGEEITITDNNEVVFSGQLSELHNIDIDGCGIFIYPNDSNEYRLLRRHLDSKELEYFEHHRDFHASPVN